jgi:tRNA A37 methylthiotransferase MiaB
LKQGAKEIWITSQDCSVYGMDQGHKLSQTPKLLKKILALNYTFKLRLGMMNPSFTYPIIDELLEIFKDKKMYKFLHLPVQTASDRLLKEMYRPGTIKQSEEIIKKFKTAFPEGTIATDIIVGYPSENPEDHKKNLAFLEKYKIDILNLSKFSLHKHTPIHKKLEKQKQEQKEKKLPVINNEGEHLINRIPTKIMNQRTSEIMRIHRKTANENKLHFQNKTLNVFVNQQNAPTLFEARDENYNIVLINARDKKLVGKTIPVTITNIGVHHMIGEVMQS